MTDFHGETIEVGDTVKLIGVDRTGQVIEIGPHEIRVKWISGKEGSVRSDFVVKVG